MTTTGPISFFSLRRHILFLTEEKGERGAAPVLPLQDCYRGRLQGVLCQSFILSIIILVRPQRYDEQEPLHHDLYKFDNHPVVKFEKVPCLPLNGNMEVSSWWMAAKSFFQFRVALVSHVELLRITTMKHAFTNNSSCLFLIILSILGFKKSGLLDTVVKPGLYQIALGSAVSIFSY